MKKIWILLSILVLLSACLTGQDNKTSFTSESERSASSVTVKWQYDKKENRDIQGLRLYQAGGSLICVSEHLLAMNMECALNETIDPFSFKLTAYDGSGNERRYPATFHVN